MSRQSKRVGAGTSLAALAAAAFLSRAHGSSGSGAVGLGLGFGFGLLGVPHANAQDSGDDIFVDGFPGDSGSGEFVS